jgi:hypothetical protein
MFKTAKNTLKNAAKDQVEFFLVLLTGVFAGSIFTLAYIKFWEKGDATFADIGGMLAGIGTVGLLYIAIKARNEWKKQFLVQQTTHAIDEYFRAYRNILKSIGEIAYASKAIKDFKTLNTLASDPEMQSHMISLETKRKSVILKAFPHKKDFTIAKIRLEHFCKKELEHAALVEEFSGYIVVLNRFENNIYFEMKIKLKELEEKLMPELYKTIPHLL